jgi:hypothetical protein
LRGKKSTLAAACRRHPAPQPSQTQHAACLRAALAQASKKGGPGGGGSSGFGSKRAPPPRPQELLTEPLVVRNTAELAGAEAMPEPRWDTFCNHLQGEWVGHYGAYTPWEGEPWAAAGGGAGAGGARCVRADMRAAHPTAPVASAPGCCRRGPGCRRPPCPLPSAPTPPSPPRAAGLPEPVWVDANNSYINQAYTRIVEARQPRADGPGDMLVRRIGRAATLEQLQVGRALRGAGRCWGALERLGPWGRGGGQETGASPHPGRPGRRRAQPWPPAAAQQHPVGAECRALAATRSPARPPARPPACPPACPPTGHEGG